MKEKNIVQLTHFERMFRSLQSIRECKRWAKIAVKTADPIKALFNSVKHDINTAPTKQEAERRAEFYVIEMVGYFHALVLEWLKRDNCGFLALTENEPHFAEFLEALGGGDHRHTNVGAQLAYQMARHELHGKRVYLVSRSLVDLLLYTELKGLTTQDLRLPERSIYIQVPPDTPLKVFNNVTHWHNLEGVYITEDVGEDGKERCWRFLAVGEEKDPLGDHMLNDALSYWRIDLPDDVKITTVLTQANKQMKQDIEMYQSSFENMENEWMRIFAFCMNVIIYATWPDCKRESVMANPTARKLWERVQKHPFKSSKRSKAQLAFSKELSMRRTILDAPITINRSRESNSNEGSGSGQPLLIRVRVHGHWKRQAVGKGRSERKLIWIEPHWRGPLDGEISNKIHKLK